VVVYRQQLKRGDLIPGMVAGIQTFGELVHFRPHIHAIVTDGVFTPDGTFICLPRIDTRRLLTEWQNNVFALFLAEVTQHIPDKGEHLVRYYGWYSHRQRGIRVAAGSGSQEIAIDRTVSDADRSSRRFDQTTESKVTQLH
jgi:hypothetical protein